MQNQDRIIAESFTVPHIRKVVSFLIRKPLFASHEREDLQQELLLYVWRKQGLFNKERGNPEAFVTMLVTSCVRMMIRSRRRAKRNGRCGSLELMQESQAIAHTLFDVGSRQSLRDHDEPLMAFQVDVPDRVYQVQIAALIKAQVPSEHHWFLIHVAERGIAGAARLHGLSRRQAQSVVRRIGECMISRAADSAAA